jgi:hypothetical protein
MVKYITILWDKTPKYINVSYDKNNYFMAHGEKQYMTYYNLEIIFDTFINIDDYELLCQDENDDYYIYNKIRDEKFIIPSNMQTNIKSNINKLLSDLYLCIIQKDEVTF